ncbi:uncharacterized protein LACBIDRAFT_306529 [Laccaria bicolor S238N-H82]|uniref:Predicted protein n=1 Tax=Laccaria bicolor (strain S238N-H82 / ATCC MYA-4686) TaxID=486041 RepID=B0DN87_LACBS|nr:uncharacterized protein LACBIDRAFT_306529 [Laccaria bicolor S238N-H82]EDR03892.1 predicted protein [Laccaria bicolor S238N-H82]|eukprot:XP_001885460.1 predicted protein [Laccaria bicolor S238N-H82]
MSNQPKDSSLNPLSSLKKVFARLRSPKPRSANDSTGAARSSSAPPIMRIPSSTIHAPDTGRAVADDQAGHPSHETVQLLQQPSPVLIGPPKSDSCTLTAPPSNLPIADPGLESASKFYNKFLQFISDASSPCRSFNYY